MALVKCPECAGTVSDKAFSCPHCGFPLKGELSKPIVKKAGKRRSNGSGTVVYKGARYKNPYQVRVNTYIDDRGYPVFDVLGNFPDKKAAEIALADFNKDPFNPDNRKKNFSEVFEAWYQWKFKQGLHDKVPKTSSQLCYVSAYKKCEPLYNRVMCEIHSVELQEILDREDLSHSMLEHVKTLFNQMYSFSMQFDIVSKDLSKYCRINKEDDDEPGIPFTKEELKLLWQNKDKPFVDTILIYCYSGFRINELALMPLNDIDLEERTFTGGLKTKFSRNRTVPIHSKIYDMVKARYNPKFNSLIYHDGNGNISESKYRRLFAQALLDCGITFEHTPHDCRHTCNTLLYEKKVDRVARYKIMGHAGKDINEKTYTHVTIEQMREALEKI